MSRNKGHQQSIGFDPSVSCSEDASTKFNRNRVCISPCSIIFLQKICRFTYFWHILNFFHGLMNFRLSRMEALLHVCNFREPNLNYFHGKYTDETIFDTIKQIAPSFSDSMGNCEWQHKIYSCTEIFTTVVTDEGFCFQFNALNAHEIFTDE